MGKVIKSIFKVVLILLLAVATIYWFEIDKWALQKIEPIFRKFASKIE